MKPHSLADHVLFRVWASALAALLVAGAASCARRSDAPPPQESLRDVVELVSAQTAATEDGRTRFTLTFRCTKPLEKNYRMLFHGYVKDESLIPPEKRNKYKFLNADHEPVKPTRTWTPGENIVHTVTLPLAAGEYNFHIGLFDRHTSKALLGKPFELGWMQLPPSR